MLGVEFTDDALSVSLRDGRIMTEFADENIREILAYSYRIIYRLERGHLLDPAHADGDSIGPYRLCFYSHERMIRLIFT